MLTEQNYSWHFQRLGRFTASENYKLFIGPKSGSGMFGDGAMTYIRRKAAELLTMDVKEEVNSYSIEWGYQYEKEACNEFVKQYGIPGIYYGKENPVFFKYKDDFGGSPDWERDPLIVPAIGADFKCPYNSDIHIENLRLKDAEDFKNKRWEYFVQAQCNMLYRGWDIFNFVSYDARFRENKLKMKILEIGADMEFRKELIERQEAAVQERDKIINELLNA